MSDAFLGEIRMFGGNFAPRGWAFCNGQILPINQNQALFSLLGTSYGGDGITTYSLPDLRGRAPVHQGQAPGLTPYVLGEKAGTENVTLLVSNLPGHNHALNAVSTGGNQAGPTNNYPAVESTGTSLNYSSGPPNTTLNTAAMGFTGSNIPFPIVQPVQCVSFIICLAGIYPSRN
jgi:microcystin-dependent protein